MTAAPVRVLHAFKVFKPEVEGGIPEALDTLLGGLGPDFRQQVLVARRSGLGRHERTGRAPVRRVTSLGTLWSLPLAPTYPVVLAHAARSVDLLVEHAPFPLADLVTGRLLPPHLGLVLHWHADIVRQRALEPLYGPLIRAALARADRVVVSHDSVVAASRFLPAVRAKIAHVPYGIDPGPWAPPTPEEADEAARARAGRPPLFVAVGRLVEYKGFPVLIEALRHVEAEVAICGTGRDEAALRAQAAALGVAERVHFLGLTPQPAVRRLLLGARALVLPSVSLAESFGLVQVEAMLTGRAILNTALPTAVPWVARDGSEALTVPPQDGAALAAALQRLALDPGLAARLGAAGRQRALELFTAERYCRAMAAVYGEALDARRAGAA